MAFSARIPDSAQSMTPMSVGERIVVVYKTLAGDCGPGCLFSVALLCRWKISCPVFFPLRLGFRPSDGSRRSSWRAVFSTLRSAALRFAPVRFGEHGYIQLGCDAR